MTDEQVNEWHAEVHRNLREIAEESRGAQRLQACLALRDLAAEPPPVLPRIERVKATLRGRR